MILKRWKTTFLLLLAAGMLLSGKAGAECPRTVLLGGIPFGVRFCGEGILVVGFTEVGNGEINPAYAAGLREGDVITAVDGEAVSTAEELSERIGGSVGMIEITYRRNDRQRSAILCPTGADGEKKAGLYIRDTAAGIGTVTFVSDEDGFFGGLGHGICRDDTGEVLTVRDGAVFEVTVTGVRKGASGEPGELKGILSEETVGTVSSNTACGVFGHFEKIPSRCGGKVGIGSRSDVHPGRAWIRCTVSGADPEEYEICITEIDRASKDNRSFSIVVTDPELIERTGGIVQGMSGSPILQDGMLIGAVTHVLVSDPEEGYGIFIDNMMSAGTDGADGGDGTLRFLSGALCRGGPSDRTEGENCTDEQKYISSSGIFRSSAGARL